MHYTVHMRCVILYPNNVWVQPDVYCQQSESGSGVRFYDVDSYKARDTANLVNSLICVATPITETKYPSPLDISGRFNVEYVAGLTTKTGYEPLHYSTAARYNALYGFHSYLSTKMGSDQPHIQAGRSHNNRICHQGHQAAYNRITGKHDKVTINKGHWGPNVYAGCAPIRNGDLSVLQEQRYSTSAA
jgi:hypothetical protein